MPQLTKYQIRRIETLRDGAEKAPANRPISVNAGDLVWLISLIDYQAEPEEPPTHYEDLQGPPGEDLGDLD